MRSLLTLVALLGLPMFTVGCDREHRGPRGPEGTTVRANENQTLTLMAPKSASITRGQTKMITVALKRHGFNDPVQVSISDLPSGVTVRESSKSIQGDKATFVLDASNDAALVKNQAIRISAEGPNNVTATQQVELSVK